MIPERYAGYETTVTLGAVNFTSFRGDVPATLDKIEANIVESGLQGVDILVFPEEALTGLGGCDACRAGAEHCDYHHELAETVPGPSTERIAALCAEHDMYVAVGLVERDPVDPETLYNSVAFIGPDGIQGTYRKLHLGSLPWVTEGVTFTPGSALPVFDTRFGPVGVQICYDFWFNPELSRILALKGARIILNSCGTFAGPGKRDYMIQTTATRAQENLCYVVSANHVGGERSPDSYGAGKVDEGRAADMLGHSSIAGPAFPRFSQVLAEAGDTEELVTATVSFEKLHRWEPIFPWRDWRASHQSGVSALIADEFTELARPKATQPDGVQEPLFRHLARLDWETAEDQKAEVATLAVRADAAGARRSRLTTGEHGFHSHISEMPPGFEVPPHTHSVSELMVILDGSIIVTDGTVLGAGDTAVIPAEHRYGFTVGDAGVRFLVARTDDAATTFTESE